MNIIQYKEIARGVKGGRGVRTIGEKRVNLMISLNHNRRGKIPKG